MATLRERLRARLGLDTSEFERGLDKSGRKVKQFGSDANRTLSGTLSEMSGLGRAFLGGLGIGIATIGLNELTGSAREAIKAVAGIGDEAKRAGLSAKAFQEWKFVAEQNRIGVDALTDGFKELSLRADEFIVTGGGSAADAFKRIGLSAGDLQGKLKDPSALMLEIIGRLGKMDKAAQIRISDELFGGAGGERFVELLSQGEAGIRKTIAEAHRAGAVLDEEMIQKADELDRKFTAIADTIARGFKRGAINVADLLITDATDEIVAFTGSVERAKAVLGDELFAALSQNAEAVDANATSISQLNQYAWDMTNTAAALATAYIDAADAAYALGDTDASQALLQAGIQMDKLVAAFKRGDISADELGSRLGVVKDRANEAVSAISAANAVSMTETISEIDRLGTALAAASGMAKSLWGWLASVAGMEVTQPSAPVDDRGQAIAEREAGFASNRPMSSSIRPRSAPPMVHENLPADEKGGGKGGGGGRSRDDFARSLTSIKEETAALEAEAVALLAAAKSGKDYGTVVDYARKKAELLTAAKKAGKAVTPELAKEIDQLAQSYATAAQSAEDAEEKLEAIQEASEKGKDALVDMFSSVLSGAKSGKEALADLLMMIAEVQLKKGLLGLMGGGGGMFGWLGGLLNVGANANGTTNWQGGLTMVGERGAELVSLPRGAQVFSNLDSQRMLNDQGAQRVGVEVVPSPYFDVRVAEVSSAGDVQVARAQQRAMPGAIRDMQARGTK